MEKAGLVATTGDANPHYVPTLPPETTALTAILDAVRSDEGTGHPTIAVPGAPPAVEAIVERIEKAVADELSALSIKDFALADTPPAPLHQVVP